MDRRHFLAGSLATSVAITNVGPALAASATSLPASLPQTRPRESGEPVDPFELLIGVDLIRLFYDFKQQRTSPVLDHISHLRQHFSAGGLEMPRLRIRDWLKLPPDGYQVLIQGRVVVAGVRPAAIGESQRGHLWIVETLAGAVRANAGRFKRFDPVNAPAVTITN